MSDPTESGGDSTTGLDSALAGALCYALGFVSGAAFLVLEKRDRFVRFHAYQAVAVFLPLFVLSAAARAFPAAGSLISLLVWPLSLILWIVLMVKAYQGERYELPVVGEWAAKQVDGVR